MPDSDTRRNPCLEGSIQPTVAHEQIPARYIAPVVASCNAHGQRQFPRPIRQILITTHAGPPASHRCQSCQWFQCANQYTAGTTLGFRDDIQALIHAVDQIHVCMRGRAKQDLRARRHTAPSMRGRVFEPQIRLGLDNACRGSAVNQDLAQQGACYFSRRAVVKAPRERFTFQTCR